MEWIELISEFNLPKTTDARKGSMSGVLEIEGSFEGKTLLFHLPDTCLRKFTVLHFDHEEMFKMCLFLWIKDQSLYHNPFVQHSFSFMVLSKQRQLWVKRHWEMLQFSFVDMKASALFYGLWGFVSSVKILEGTAWASLSPCSLACQGLPWGQIDRWFSCRESGTYQHPFRGLCMGTGWGYLAGVSPEQWFSKGVASPRPTNAKVGVWCCVWSPPAVGEPESCCHPAQRGTCPLLWALPHSRHRLLNCPPSWSISVEIWE